MLLTSDDAFLIWMFGMATGLILGMLWGDIL
jgi:hypothetical protein